MLAKKLRTETHQLHELVEKVNFSTSIGNGSIEMHDYVIVLKRLLAFYTQTQVLAESVQLQNPLPSTFFSEKIKLLEEDLGQMSASAPPSCEVFSTVADYEFIGFCYVALGSMMGGSMIHRSFLQRSKNNLPALPTTFYESCQGSVDQYWQLYQRYLAVLPADEHSAVIQGAKISYLYFTYLSALITS